MTFDERILWAVLGAAVLVLLAVMVGLIFSLFTSPRNLGAEPPAYPPFQPLEHDAPRVHLYDKYGMEVHETSPPKP